MPKAVARGAKASARGVHRVTVAGPSRHTIPQSGGIHSITEITRKTAGIKEIKEAEEAAKRRRQALLSGKPVDSHFLTNDRHFAQDLTMSVILH